MSLKLLNRARKEIEEILSLLTREAFVRSSRDEKFRTVVKSMAENAMATVNQSDSSVEAFDFLEYTDDAYYQLLLVATFFKQHYGNAEEYTQICGYLERALKDISEAVKIAGAK